MFPYRIIVAVVAIASMSCAHLVPANWRSFEGDLPDVRTVIEDSLKELGLTKVIEESSKGKIVTQWRYQTVDSLNKQRSRIVISWERDERDNAMIIFAKHENQSVEESFSGGIEYRHIIPDQELQTTILDVITSKIVGPMSAAADEK